MTPAVAEAEEELALSKRPQVKLQTPEQPSRSRASTNKRPSLFYRLNPELDLKTPTLTPFTEGTTLLDWFEETDNADLAAALRYTGDDKPSHEHSKKRMLSKSRVVVEEPEEVPEEIELTEEEMQLEMDRQIYKWLDREMMMIERSRRFAAMEEKHLLYRLRMEISYACLESAGSARKAFNALDQNKNGHSSMNEFEGGIRELGVNWQEITGFKKVTELFRLFDQAKKGYVTFADLFPYDYQRDVDPMKLSTAEFWDYWCQHTKDVSSTVVRGPTWQPNGFEEELAVIARSRKMKEAADVKKDKMRVQWHNLKYNGKSDARCRELVFLHLPRGTGPNTMDEIPTFCENDVQACRKTYTDAWQESVRKVEKTIGVMHDQRSSLHKTKQQLWHTTEEPHIRAKIVEEQRALIGIGGLFKKNHHEEAEQ
jgi:hypothetical protein